MQCITCIYGKYPLYCLFGAYKSELLLVRRHWQYKLYVCIYIYVFAHYPPELPSMLLLASWMSLLLLGPHTLCYY